MKDSVTKYFLLNTALGLLQLKSHLPKTMWREAKAILKGGFVKPKATHIVLLQDSSKEFCLQMEIDTNHRHSRELLVIPLSI